MLGALGAGAPVPPQHLEAARTVLRRGVRLLEQPGQGAFQLLTISLLAGDHREFLGILLLCQQIHDMLVLLVMFIGWLVNIVGFTWFYHLVSFGILTAQ